MHLSCFLGVDEFFACVNFGHLHNIQLHLFPFGVTTFLIMEKNKKF